VDEAECQQRAVAKRWNAVEESANSERRVAAEGANYGRRDKSVLRIYPPSDAAMGVPSCACADGLLLMTKSML